MCGGDAGLDARSSRHKHAGRLAGPPAQGQTYKGTPGVGVGGDNMGAGDQLCTNTPLTPGVPSWGPAIPTATAQAAECSPTSVGAGGPGR